MLLVAINSTVMDPAHHQTARGVRPERDTPRERERERPGSIPLHPRMAASLAAMGGNWALSFQPESERLLSRVAVVAYYTAILITTTTMAVATVDPSRSNLLIFLTSLEYLAGALTS